jgi:hypothetical protein
MSSSVAPTLSGRALAAFSAVLLAFFVALTVTFTHCLKRREDEEKGGSAWKCRKATRRGACLAKRARSAEQAQKACNVMPEVTSLVINQA